MADITWSAYALAMFTPEQRAAAAGATNTYEPEEEVVLLPPAGGGSTSGGQPTIIGRSTSELVAMTGLNPNNPADLAVLNEQGWTFQNGTWVKGTYGASTTGGAGTYNSGSGSFNKSASLASSGTVLGYSIPAAAPVLLPSWIGGRIGVIREPGGYRPESGGTPLFQPALGKMENWMKVYPKQWIEE